MGTLGSTPSSFVFTDDTRTKGDALGLALSTHPDACRPGQFTFFTSKEVRGRAVPHKNPYAVLPLFREADDAAAIELFDLWLAYEESLSTTSAAEFPAPPGLSYLPYQRSGIAYALARRHVLFGDEPGLGKTIEALGVCNAVDAARVLVVCPASVRLQWARELTRWSVRPRYQWQSGEGRIQTILTGADGLDTAAGAVITSYQLAAAKGIGDALAQLPWDVVIFDEAHYLKSYTAHRTRRLLGSWGETEDAELFPGLVANAGRVLALTGTPLPNRPRECYTIARAFDWDSIDRMSEDAFNKAYNPQVILPNGFRLEFTNRLLELQARLRSRFMVRRAKADVLKDLPAKTYELAYIEPNGEVKKVIRAEKMLGIDPENLSGDAAVLGAIATVRREMGRAKAPAVKEHVDMLLDGGVSKIVLFAYHTEVIEYLAQRFGGAAVTLQGATSAKARALAVQRFQDDPHVHVFIGQLTAAGTGIDGLQNVCSHVVFAEASWTPGENEQCVDRLHRIGQRSSVLCQFLVAPGSLDERILGSAINKAQTINVALDAPMGGLL